MNGNKVECLLGVGGRLSSVLARGAPDHGGCSLYLLNIQVSPMVVLFSVF